jgi:hypothetical protein
MHYRTAIPPLHPYAHHAVHMHHAGGDWFSYALLSGLIHAAVYHMISPLFRGQGVYGSIAIGVVVLAIAFFVWKRLAQRRFA